MIRRAGRAGRRLCLAIAALAVWPAAGTGQQAQNPSPMVEHTRRHPRLVQRAVPGQRWRVEPGSLFVPDSLGRKPGSAKPLPLFVFFHGGAWVPEVSAERAKTAVLTVQVGSGSMVYAAAFADPGRFGAMLAEAEAVSGFRVGTVTVGGWSAGCGALRELVKQPGSYARIDRFLAIDGIHTGYPSGRPGPQESAIDPANLEPWLALARDAVAGRKSLLVTHSEIFPGTFASTTETADWLVRQLGLTRRAVLKWGPMGTQQLSEARAGRF